jgi:hypothetical protein
MRSLCLKRSWVFTTDRELGPASLTLPRRIYFLIFFDGSAVKKINWLILSIYIFMGSVNFNL